MNAINLDLDVLRTLLAAQRLGGFGRAAEQVGRSQSAVSQQIDKLEKRLGQPLFRKQGRGLVPTEAGETVLTYARRILDLNDEAVAAVRGAAIEGEVRFGLPGDFAETFLPAVLARFGRSHPGVRVEVTVDRNAVLLERLEKGQLDLAFSFDCDGRRGGELVATLPMAWIGPASSRRWPVAGLAARGEPVPLALFSASCIFRQAAIDALDGAGIPWCIVFTSPGLSGLWAAVAAGLGITLRTPAGLPDTLAVLEGMPPVGSVELAMHDAGRELAPATVRLKEIVLDALAENLSTIPGAVLAARN